MNLLDFIQDSVEKNSDKYKIWDLVVPLCNGVINEEISLPVPYSDLPLKHEIKEGVLPNDSYKLYADFKLTISGIAREIPEDVEIDGISYTYANFEE